MFFGKNKIGENQKLSFVHNKVGFCIDFWMLIFKLQNMNSTFHFVITKVCFHEQVL